MGKRIPVVLYLTVVAFVAIALYSCSASIKSVSRDRSPESQASAAATGTAIAPILEPTRTYNRNVVPAIQVEETKQARETIQAREAWNRTVFKTWSIIKITVMSTIAALTAGVGCAGIVMLALAVVRYGRATVELSPVSALPGRGRPVQLSGVIYDPGSDAVIDIRVPAPANIEKIIARSEGDAARIAAVAAIIRGDPGRGWTRADRRVLELAEAA